MCKAIVGILAFQLITQAFGANVLYLNGVASPSHHIFNRALAVGLAASHNVTFVSADLSKTPIPNLHYIHLEKIYSELYESDDSLDLIAMAKQSLLTQLKEFDRFIEKSCDGMLASEGLDTILNYPKDFKFDVVVHDNTCGYCLLPLIEKFNFPPLVAVSAFSNPPYSIFTVGGQKYPAYIPHYLMDYPLVMSFAQRVYNLFVYGVDFFTHKYHLYPELDRKIQKRFNLKSSVSGLEFEQRTALMLINTDNAVDFPEPLQPNMIQVGGLQIAEPKPLKEDMEKFILSAKKGTILMSLGTNIQSSMLGDELLTKIIKTFAQLPEYNFLWKFEADPKDLPVKLSKNVMIEKFLPQNDILAHPRIVGFISHSGLLSSHEALYHGVPVIGMPFFADQFSSIAKMIKKGVAERINFQTLTTQSFKEIIQTVVESPKYATNSKRVSKLFRDKPSRPLATAIWWIDYVIRNPNMDHMKSPTLETGFFVAWSLDIILAAIVVLHVFVYINYRAFKKIFGSKNQKKKSE